MNMLVGCMLVFRQGPQKWDAPPLEPFINGMIEKGWRSMERAGFRLSYCTTVPVEEPVVLEDLAQAVLKLYLAPPFNATFTAKEHPPVDALVDIRLIANNKPDDAPFHQETLQYSFIEGQGAQLDIDFNADSMFTKENLSKFANLIGEEMAKHTADAAE